MKIKPWGKNFGTLISTNHLITPLDLTVRGSQQSYPITAEQCLPPRRDSQLRGLKHSCLTRICTYPVYALHNFTNYIINPTGQSLLGRGSQFVIITYNAIYTVIIFGYSSTLKHGGIISIILRKSNSSVCRFSAGSKDECVVLSNPGSITVYSHCCLLYTSPSPRD